MTNYVLLELAEKLQGLDAEVPLLLDERARKCLSELIDIVYRLVFAVMSQGAGK